MGKFIKITAVSGRLVIFHCNTSFSHFGCILKVGGWLERQGGKLKFIKESFAYMLHSALHGWFATQSSLVKTDPRHPFLCESGTVCNVPCIFHYFSVALLLIVLQL